MAFSSWEDHFTCKWTPAGQLDITGFSADMPVCLQFYLISVSRSNNWPRALQLIQEGEGHCFISGTGILFPLDYESSSSDEDYPGRGQLPEDEVEFFSGNFPKDRVKKSAFLRIVAKCLEERHKICGSLEGESEFLKYVTQGRKTHHATDHETQLMPAGSPDEEKIITELPETAEGHRSLSTTTTNLGPSPAISSYPNRRALPNRQATAMKREDVAGTGITEEYDPQYSSFYRNMATEKDYNESLDKVEKTQKSLKKNVQQLQQLTQRRREFQRVREFYQTAPEWSSQEGQDFRGMMENIKEACDSYGDLVEEAHAYVLRVKNFAKDTNAFTTVAQENLSPHEEDELLHDWRKSIDRMQEANNKIEKLKANFRKVLEKLRRAQGKASEGTVRGREKAEASAIKAERSSDVATGLTLATRVAAPLAVATGGFALPIPAGVGAICSKFAEAMYAADSETHGKWRKAYDFVARQLDEAFGIVDSLTEDCQKTLNELFVNSNQLLDKFKAPLNQKKLERTDYFKRKCLRLKEDSEDLHQTCDEYISRDDEIRRLVGGIGRLSLE